jgi:hypothetical protein
MTRVRDEFARAVLIGLTLVVACGGGTPGVSGASGGSNGGSSSQGGGSTGGTKASAGADPSAGTRPSGGSATTGSAGATEAEGGGQGADSGCAAYAKVRCARYQTCLPMRFAILYSSLSDCEQASGVTCEGELTAPGTSRTAESAAACAADIAQQNCADWQSTAPQSCTLPGSLAVDAPCEYSSQCESTFCSRAAGSWCGVCKARDTAGVACDAGQASCARGLRCAYGCTTGDSCAAADQHFRCAEAKAEGVACGGPTECRATLACLDGVCRKGVGLGEPCDPNLSGNCDPSADLYCVAGAPSSSARCVKNSYVAGAAACNTVAARHCSGLGACDGTDGHLISDGAGTCTAPGGPGDACSSDKLCRQPALCLNGVCTSPVNAATCH